MIATPARMPTPPPIAASMIDSATNCAATWRRVAPSARRTPISVRRSSTEITIRLAMPIAPTTSATPPRPRKSAVDEPATATRAASASDGRLTETSSGASGFAVGASRLATATTREVSART